MYALARELLRSRDTALDVCQDACVAALRSFGTLRGDNVGAWLRRITANRAVDELRRRKRLGPSLDDTDSGGAPLAERLEAAGPAAPDLAESAAFREDLRAALDDLPDAYRVAFVLREGEELSYEEIATMLGVPIGTVRSRISRARAALADRLKEWR
jgi:RNA polymerase sigma-70 factor (ECF subfamily)